jgi:hypothetical protein
MIRMRSLISDAKKVRSVKKSLFLVFEEYEDGASTRRRFMDIKGERNSYMQVVCSAGSWRRKGVLE